jgi:hypothetical protein
MIWLITLSTVGALIAAVLIIGWLLPQRHRATVAKDLPLLPHVVWKAITDVEALPSWHPQVKGVELLPGRAKSWLGERHIATVTSFPTKLWQWNRRDVWCAA